MKAYLLLCCLWLCFFSPIYAFSVKDRLYPQINFPSGTTLVHDKIKGISIIKPAQRKRVFITTGTTAQQLGKDSAANIIINASYFGRQGNNFFPAGHTSTDPIEIDASYCQRDRNLCGYIFPEKLMIHENIEATIDPTISGGPLLVRAGKINKELTERYSHRQQKTKRTVLVRNNKGAFFILTHKGYTLEKLAKYIQKKFGKTATAINLDGGSSTSLRLSPNSGASSGYSINIDKRLPTYFIIN